MTQSLQETSRALTLGICIEVRSTYLAADSLPVARRYAFQYSVRITNESAASVQLLSRHWIVTDAKGLVQEVQGAGVVGEQPILHPGQHFRYTSSVTLPTSWGEMRGAYLMHSVTGKTFEASVAPFLLALPHTLN